MAQPAQTVRLRLRKPSRVFTFISRNIPIARNDSCIVRSDRGLEYGVCVLPPEECSPEEEKRHKMTVVRKATHHDETTYKQIKIDEERAMDLCRGKIAERKLPMKLVECEYAFDRKKVVFYFIAEDRVDFRELVRDLAQELKARIELRHIQVRDQAKMVGGIGSCGRELCCTTWMRDFIPISMKMAKRQNLSLNPTKISGQCGRLMCCLSYENELYSKTKKKITDGPPKPEAIREKMEAKPEEAMEILIGGSPVETDQREPRNKSRQQSRRRESVDNKKAPSRQTTDSQQAPKADTESKAPEQQAKQGESGTTTGDKPKRSRRRRRKRRGRGGGGGGSSNKSGGTGSSSS